MKFKFILFAGFLFLISTCRMPSDPVGEINILKRLNTINTGGDCLDLDIDLDDSVIVAAANYNGFKLYDIQFTGNLISELIERTHITSFEMDKNIGDNRAQIVKIASLNNKAFILDKEDHIWLLDYNNSIDTVSAFLSKGSPSCYDARSISIAIRESINDIRIFSLIKHYSSGSYWFEDSKSIINAKFDLLNLNEETECNYMLNKNENSNVIFYSESLLILGVGELGVQVFSIEVADENTCIYLNNMGEMILAILDEDNDCLSLDNGFIINEGELIPGVIWEFDTPGEVEALYSISNSIFAGLSKSNGFIKVQLNSDGSITDYSQYGIGYSIKGIHHNGNILAVAAGHDGVLLYNWDGVNLSFKGRIDTAYANNVKVALNVIFIATEDGIDIIQVEI